jgi:prepilin-type N-terminal cleavage/methylation domain-containing protein
MAMRTHEWPRDEAGFSLVELLVATTILTVGLLAAARVFAASTMANAGARTITSATVLALEKMEELRAVPMDDPALERSPPDALTVDIAGYSDRPDPAYVRRWSVEPLPSYPDAAVAVRVAVLRPGAPGRAYLETIKARKPAGAPPE